MMIKEIKDEWEYSNWFNVKPTAYDAILLINIWLLDNNKTENVHWYLIQILIYCSNLINQIIMPLWQLWFLCPQRKTLRNP